MLAWLQQFLFKSAGILTDRVDHEVDAVSLRRPNPQGDFLSHRSGPLPLQSCSLDDAKDFKVSMDRLQ